MKLSRLWLSAVGLALFTACAGPVADEGAVDDGAAPAAVAAPEADVGWITLLDGSTVEGWNTVGDANWTVGDGFVEATGGMGYLVSPQSYRDFELRVEFWVDAVANSGVFIRCSDPTAISDTTAYEVNIYDMRPDQTYRTGSIVNFASPPEVIDAAGQWNTFEIRAEGSHLVVVFNGVETVNVEDMTYDEGPIGLQYGAGIVRFRNVEIRPL